MRRSQISSNGANQRVQLTRGSVLGVRLAVWFASDRGAPLNASVGPQPAARGHRHEHARTRKQPTAASVAYGSSSLRSSAAAEGERWTSWMR